MLLDTATGPEHFVPHLSYVCFCQAHISLQQVFTRLLGLGARIRTNVSVCMCVSHKEDYPAFIRMKSGSSLSSDSCQRPNNECVQGDTRALSRDQGATVDQLIVDGEFC